MKKCKYCMTEIDKKAKVCPQCHKKQNSTFKTILCVFIIIIGIGIIASATSGNNSTEEDKCYITLEEFNNLNNGMTYDEVKEIIGCDGTVISDSEIGNTSMTMYSWYGKDGISNANATFDNDKMINKTQIGLK